MAGARASSLIAGQQLAEIVRLLHRAATGGRVPYVAFQVGLVILAWGGTGILLQRCWQAGRELGVGAGPGLATAMVFAAGSVAGAGLVVGVQLRSRVLRAERERLAILPLGRLALSVHASVPVVVPSALGALVSLLSIIALSTGMQRPPTSLLAASFWGTALALGMELLTMAVPAGLPGAQRWRVGLLVGGLLGLYGHGLALISDANRDPRSEGAWNPVVLMLLRDSEFSAVELLLAAAASCALGTLLLSIGVRRPGSRAPRNARPSAPSRRQRWPWPAAWRVRLALVRIMVRHSAVTGEVLIMGSLGAVTGLVAAHLSGQGRADAADVLLVLTAALAALPTLGIRAALGPTERLRRLGVHPADARTSLVFGAILASGGVAMLVSTVLVVRGVDLVTVARFWSFSVIVGALAFIAANLMRELAAFSVGRAITTIGYTVAVFVALNAGLPSRSLTATTSGAVLAIAAGWLVLRATLTDRSLR